VCLAYRGRTESLTTTPELLRDYYAFSRWIRDAFGSNARLVPDMSFSDDPRADWYEYTESIRLESLKVRPRPPRWLTWLRRRFRRAHLRVLP
jgi:hypothetical protein